MMPDLGRYALEVASAYISSLAILAGLVVLYLRRDARTRQELDAAENRQERHDG